MEDVKILFGNTTLAINIERQKLQTSTFLQTILNLEPNVEIIELPFIQKPSIIQWLCAYFNEETNINLSSKNALELSELALTANYLGIHTLLEKIYVAITHYVIHKHGMSIASFDQECTRLLLSK